MAVQIYDLDRMFRRLCKTTGKWGLYVFLWGGSDPGGQEEDEIIKAAPYLAGPYDGDEGHAKSQILLEGHGVILCDTEEEVNHYFNLTVGDDGPTDLNPYDGPARVYATTCDPTGQGRNENT